MKQLIGYGICLCLFACLDTMQNPDDIDVDQCSEGADVENATMIVYETKDSVHEMITCGNLTFLLIDALIRTAQDFAFDESSLPSAFSVENGLYTTTGTGVSMDLFFIYGPETPGGEPGERLESNLFDFDSYLQNATFSTVDEDIHIRFEQPGPLVELLGKGASPVSPLVMTPTDMARFSAILSTLKLDSNINVDHQKPLSVITYSIDNDPVFVTSFLSSQTMEMNKATASATRSDLEQEFTPTKWDIQYGETAGTLDGVIEADVIGGPFDFQAVLEYNPLFVEPTITISCID